MADPVLVTITAGAAPTQVATGVQACLVKEIKTATSRGTKIQYMEMYLTAGATAPTDQSLCAKWDGLLEFNNSANADVYIAVLGDEDGIVRVDR